MAIQLPNTLYSGGNVKFDSTPAIKYYQQIEAERRAKQDAIDDYMRGLRSKVTPSGMRTVDLPAFNQLRKKWQDFGIQNRERMARNPELRAQFEGMAQDLITFAEESKAEEAAKKPFIDLMTDPNKRKSVRPEVFTMVQEHDKPLYTTDETGALVRDYNRKRLDYTSKLFKEPQFDFQKEFKTWTGEMKPGEMIELDKPYTDKQTGLVFFPAKEKFNKEQIAQIGRNAIRSIKDDEDQLNYYATRLAAVTQKEYEQLDNIYRKYYGEPIGTSPEKLAAAEAVSIAEQSVRDLKPVSKSDYERRQADKIQNIILNKMPSAGATTEVNDLYSIIEKAVDTPKKGIWGKFSRRGYTPLTELTVDAQKMILDYAKVLTGLTGGQKGVEYLNNQSIKLKRTDTGGIGIYDASNNDFIGELPRVGTNIKVQPDVKAKREVIRRGEPAKTKTETFIFPGGKTKF